MPERNHAAGERSLLDLAGVLDDEEATALREAIDELSLTPETETLERLSEKESGRD
ncbi:hypothetical protein [Halostella salina]|uniref:hypothetical protein n=1 Tax=Halostella salina TaxID=1547897 RepID=UPI0013CF1E6F|nr:hypothetical protein [Halostella salina]